MWLILRFSILVLPFMMVVQSDYLEGDMILPDNFFRNGIIKINRWPNATIPYEIMTDLSPKLIENIKFVMERIMVFTCIKFVERTSADTNYVTILKGDKCQAYTGLKVGQQRIFYADYCSDLSTVFHELFHCIGLYHTQSRTDRDKYLTIYQDNILPDSLSQFEIKPNIDSYGMPYNYLSVMHYGATSYTSNGKTTMFPKDPKFLQKIGTVDRPHEDDYELIRRIYECPKKPYPKPPQQQFYRQTDCVDDGDCSGKEKTCHTDSLMKYTCRKTCKFCVPQGGKCEDQANNCIEFLDDCLSNTYMLSGCHKSCGLC